ncbi:MAG TPA: lysophospholipid acyltransferase family protein [Polyangiaceae bacterium]|nr:lysophospholipid acyltransferase family protein [Polyangiaceae bacterium]
MIEAARTLTHAVVETLRISVPTVAEAVLGRSQPASVYDARLRSWSRELLEHARARVRAEGLEKIGDGREVFVVMSNHQSVYDIPVLFQALPMSLRMVAKQELFRVPVWGRAMRYSGFVAIDRSDRRRAIESLAVAKQKMQDEGVSIWIAPEGTRSRTGELGPFKSGGFHLALDAGLRILPVSIAGTFELLQADTANIKKGGDVRVAVHEPVDPRAYGPGRRAELMADVRAAIASELGARA